MTSGPTRCSCGKKTRIKENASRAQREDVAAGRAKAVTAENDDRSRFAEQFDWDPGVGPRPPRGS